MIPYFNQHQSILQHYYDYLPEYIECAVQRATYGQGYNPDVVSIAINKVQQYIMG